MSKRVVFTGPESSGKTYLSQKFSKRYKCSFIPEYARLYLNNLNREYTIEDLRAIEIGQQELEITNSGTDLIIQDTDFLTLWIWYKVKYDHYPERVYNYLQRHLPTLYLLCAPDIPWVADAQRENPNDRDELFEIYLGEIHKLDVEFEIIEGDFEEREAICSHVFEELV